MIFIIKQNMKYQYNLTAFEKINEDSAYFLGLLYADGNLSDKGRITLNQSIKDIDIVEKFKTFLGTNKPIRVVEVTNSVSFSFQNKMITKQLINLGLEPRKSLTLKFPMFIKKIYLKDFIRGYFDGDGCVSLTKNKTTSNLRIHLVGTYDMLFNIKKYLTDVLSINDRKINQITIGKNTFQLEITKKLDVQNIKDLLYNNSKYFLSRKRNIFFTNINNNNEDCSLSSKYKNICYREKRKRWRATYYLNNIRKEKSFKHEIEAFNFLESLD
jgi:hypothetical protein